MLKICTILEVIDNPKTHAYYVNSAHQTTPTHVFRCRKYLFYTEFTERVLHQFVHKSYVCKFTVA